MPQMSPYNWMTLFIMFNYIMLIFLSYNNFFMIPSLFKKYFVKKYMYMWKW